MNSTSFGQPPRRPLAVVNQIGTAQLHLRNPFVVAFWSALFPGLGHVLLSQYIKGFILFLWEVFINQKAHINLALLYTLHGDFQLVRDIIDLRWSLLYIPTYIFAIWDSFRVAVDLNKHYILARRENAPITALVMNPLSVSYLDKRSPFMTAAWCASGPGLSQFMLHRLLHAVFFVFWWIVVVYQSNILTALHLTCFGAFAEATTAVNPHWLMNIPSLFFFCIYAAYVNTVESNKLFDLEQSQFLRKHYQSAEFPYPANRENEAGAAMFIISVFRHTLDVELAVTALAEEGVAAKDILAVPIEKEAPGMTLFDSMYSSSGNSLFDLAMILGALMMLFGCIYGFLLNWGPVIWGVIGAATGFGIGVLVKRLILKKKKTTGLENEVVIFVACNDNRTEQIKRLLSDNGALGISIVKSAAS